MASPTRSADVGSLGGDPPHRFVGCEPPGVGSTPRCEAITDAVAFSLPVMTSIPDPYRTPHGLNDELRHVLTQEGTAALGTINPDGSPQMTVVQFSLGESDRVYIPTNRSTRKVNNTLDRPHVTALVDVGGGWVSCTGRARILHGSEAADLNRGVDERLLTEAGLVTIGRFLEAHEDSTIEITPTTWSSWQADVMLAWFEEQGIDPGDPGDWMRDLTER